MMTRNRLERLERQMNIGVGGKGKFVVVSDAGSTAGEVEAVLREAGYPQHGKGSRGILVNVMRFSTIYEGRDGRAMPPDRPPQILWVGDMK